MKINSKHNNRLLKIVAHIFLGFIISFVGIESIYGIGILIFGVSWILLTKNRNEEALVMASYTVGAEVFLRMTHGFILYETGKYYVFIFLLIGAIVGKNTNKPNVLFVFFALFLFFGIPFTSVPEGESIRNAIVFNLSGPVLLVICSLYLYQRKVKREQLIAILFSMLLPIFSMACYLYFRTPSLKEIAFGGVASFEASGGFGPNQVATILGLGIFIMTVFIVMKEKLTGFIIIDGLLLAYLVYRGLLTFSRGGIITGAVAIFFFLIFYLIYRRDNTTFNLKIVSIILISLLGLWVYTSDATNGMLNNRYTGKNARGIQKKDVTSGRLDILTEQYKSFIENPIVGIGVGNGKFKREAAVKKTTAASHNEIGRLIEEHGLMGIFGVLLLFFSPINLFINQNNYSRAFLISFFLFWLLTIGHSAMRIAFPSLIYGLCLMNIIDEE